MALIRPQVSHGCPNAIAPIQGAAIVAHMACIGGLRHLGQVLLHTLWIATKTVARQQQGIARHLLGVSIGSHIGDPQST